MGLTPFHEKYLFSCFRMGRIVFPQLLFGTSPFFGAGQFKERSIRYYREFYLNPQNIGPVQSWVRSVLWCCPVLGWVDIGFPELCVELRVRVSYQDDLEDVLEAFGAPVHPLVFTTF